MGYWSDKWDSQEPLTAQEVAAFARLDFMEDHHVKVWLTYTGPNNTPYKWRGRCICGWNVLSWQWIRDDGSGAFGNALCHMGLCGELEHCTERVKASGNV